MKIKYKITFSLLVVVSVILIVLLMYKAYVYTTIHTDDIRKLSKMFSMKLYCARPPFYVFTKDVNLADSDFRFIVKNKNILLTHDVNKSKEATDLQIGLVGFTLQKRGNTKNIVVATRDKLNFDYNADGYFDAINDTTNHQWEVMYGKRRLLAERLKPYTFRLHKSKKIVYFDMREGKFVSSLSYQSQ